ncbi:carboxypeptidase regulatory-like domain-containing protein [bacterium]|nr:hypothetical protein [bacterium]MBU3956288.1 carboxypeptidase regulatory-like domain-containing protein [bacterium]
MIIRPRHFVALAFLLFSNTFVRAGDWTNYTTLNTSEGLGSNKIRALVSDADGNKWFATDGGGASRFDGANWIPYKITDGLANNYVFDIAVAGNILWFATGGGVSRYANGSWTTYTEINGLAENYVISIASDTTGGIWCGTFNRGVSKFDGAAWTTYTALDGLAGNRVQAIAVETNGTKWFGTNLGVSSFFYPDWTTYTTADGLACNDVRAIALEGVNNKWFATYGGGVSRFDGSLWSTYTAANSGLASDYVFSVTVDRDGNKWFGTNKGVSKFDGASWTTYTSADGLAENNVYAAFIEKRIRWFGTDGGASKFDDGSITISGYVKHFLEAGVGGVTVELTGRDNMSAVTDADGFYSFNALDWGDYLITPVKSGYEFNPASISTSSLRADFVSQNFTGNRPPDIPSFPSPSDGEINVSTSTALIWSGGDPDAGDTVVYDVYLSTFSPPVFRAGGAGLTYSPEELEAGSVYYWKIIAKDNYGGETEGEVWQFTALPKPETLYFIKGRVKNTAGGGLASAAITITGNASSLVLTDSDGYYEFTGLSLGDYTVTPVKENYLFAPPSLNFFPLSEDASEQDFTASGIITESGGSGVIGGAAGYVRPRSGEKAKIVLNSSAPGDVSIKIYTLDRRLVWETSLYVSAFSQQNVFWDCKNKSGQEIASGIYLVNISGAGIDLQRKVAVIR